jgi:hypothetical protein
MCLGGDYEECLLGCKTPVRISQETLYISATEPSRLRLCKIWGFHGGDDEKCLLRYKTPVRTSQETHYISTKEPNRLMLCKIWGFHGGDYEECRLLRHKTPVHTSREIYYVSATEPSRLMLCKIWSFSRQWLWRMASSWMLRSVALVRTDVSLEHSAFIIRVTRKCELGTTLAVTSNQRTLPRNTMWVFRVVTNIQP